MEGKVLLYDANDVKIGETFVKRARQLVKQQRAAWINGSHEAIRFAPGAENMEAEATRQKGPVGVDDSKLIALAAKRVAARKRFIIHSIVFIPIWSAIFAISMDGLFDGWLDGGVLYFAAFICGAGLAGYIIRIGRFIMPRLKKYRIFSVTKEERMQKQINREAARLRREMQGV